MHIRDPIHGSIEITEAERAVIDSRFFQRLRHIKQLGFSDLAFPGATHSRYAHSIGAMSVAGRFFDALYRKSELAPADLQRLRQTLRLAVLLHDLGHPPLSHTSERILPPRAALRLPAWTDDGEQGQATHEDMTLLLILESGLADIIRSSFADLGITPEHVASLVCGLSAPGPSAFVFGGVDHAPLLRQVVSSELDADRMDYLLRDSFFTGVNYGRYDHDWITQNVEPVERDGALYLAIHHRAVFAFEDFLLSRHHMFLSVYYHYTSINYETMLGRFYDSAPDEFQLPPDPEGYVATDDMSLLMALRTSDNPWAKRIVERRGYRLIVELNQFEANVDVSPLTTALTAAGIDWFEAESQGTVSKYFASGKRSASIFVRTAQGTYQPIEQYTPLFQRHSDAARLVRIYVDPDRANEARALAGPLARR